MDAGIVGVRGLGSVAGFAGDDDVLPEFFLIDDVGVTGLTDVVSSVSDGAGGNFSNGGTPIVAVLAKTAGDDGGAQDHERDQGDGHDHGEPNEVLDVFEQVRLPGARLRARYFARKKRNDLRYREFVGGTMIEITGGSDVGHPRV